MHTPPTSMAAASNHKMIGLDYDEHHFKCSPTLRFSVGERRFVPETENARMLIAAMDSAVAARADDGPDVEALEASFVYDPISNFFYVGYTGTRGYTARHDHAANITSAHLARWLRFGACRVTGSFELSVPTIPPPAPSGSTNRCGFARQCDAAAVREIRELYAELPESARAEKLSLTLGDAELIFPAVSGADAFSALTDLFLSHTRIDPGEDANLGRMLSSSSCPRLRRLRLEHVAGLAALRFEAADTLEELWLAHLKDLSVLEVDAPGLHTLRILECDEISGDNAAAKVSVSAPALEVLGSTYGVPLHNTELTGAASVRRLEELNLYSHGFPPGHPQSDPYMVAMTAWLLEQCVAVESLEVKIWSVMQHTADGGGTAELVGLLPRVPTVTNLSIEARVKGYGGPGHRLSHSTARLVARCCGSLQHVSVAFDEQSSDPCEDPNCFCSPPASEAAEIMSGERLEQLVEAKISMFRPLPDQMSFVRLLIAMAPALERMTVELERSSEDDGEPPLPCDRGHWARAASGSDNRPAYEWTPAAVAAP